MPRKPKADIQCKVLAVLRTRENQRQRIELRLVKWSVDGKEGKSKLENRTYLKRKDGTFSDWGKSTGMDHDDCKFLVDNWAEMEVFFQ